MENKRLEKLVRILRVLVVITFICNIIALLVVPMLVLLSPKGLVEAGLDGLSYFFGIKDVSNDEFYFPLSLFFILSWLGVWETAYHAVLTMFLWVCGICTAIILWQAKNVLDILLRGSPFVTENALHLRKAALCCFVISFASFCRTVWGFFYYQSLSPLLTYNFLFCPIFLMGGLLFLVMSALFRQAAEMKAENDLTI